MSIRCFRAHVVSRSLRRGSAVVSAAGCRDISFEPKSPAAGGAAARGSFIAAKERIIAYWQDECARDLDRLMTHFARDAEVITPDGVYRGREAIAALYRKSFDDFPGLPVDVKAGFVGRDAHCFEYSAVLSGGADNRWLVEGVNLIRLQGGLISGLRSFEDAPRRRLSD